MFRPQVILFLFAVSVNCAEYDHEPVHYEERTARGTYNYGYDTGRSGSHQFHQESRDETGRVRGRYGYTDPNGKLRLVYYSSGQDGYNAWGDLPAKEPSPTFSTPVQILKAPYEAQKAVTKVSKIENQQLREPGKQPVVERYVSKSYVSPAEKVRTQISTRDDTSISAKATVQQVDIKGRLIEPSSVKGELLLPRPSPVKGKISIPPQPSSPIKGHVVVTSPPSPPPPPVKGQQAKVHPLPPPPPVKGERIVIEELSVPASVKLVAPLPPPPSSIKGSIKGEVVIQSPIEQTQYPLAPVKSPLRAQIRPLQYRAPYPPAGSHTRCWCE